MRQVDIRERPQGGQVGLGGAVPDSIEDQGKLVEFCQQVLLRVALSWSPIRGIGGLQWPLQVGREDLCDCSPFMTLDKVPVTARRLQEVCLEVLNAFEPKQGLDVLVPLGDQMSVHALGRSKALNSNGRGVDRLLHEKRK